MITASWWVVLPFVLIGGLLLLPRWVQYRVDRWLVHHGRANLLVRIYQRGNVGVTLAALRQDGARSWCSREVGEAILQQLVADGLVRVQPSSDALFYFLTDRGRLAVDLVVHEDTLEGGTRILDDFIQPLLAADSKLHAKE